MGLENASIAMERSGSLLTSENRLTFFRTHTKHPVEVRKVRPMRINSVGTGLTETTQIGFMLPQFRNIAVNRLRTPKRIRRSK